MPTHPLPTGHRPPVSPLLARYAHLRDDPRLRRALTIRSRVAQAIRGTLQENGFVEVETPLLQRDHRSRPFPVGTAALGDRLYLRSCPLYLRGLLAAGYPRVFEIARMFRDEPIDATHQPEYSLIEVYQADADYQQMRTLCRRLLVTAAVATAGAATVRLGSGHVVDLAGAWPSRAFYDALSDAAGTRLDPNSTNAHLRAAAARHAIALTAASPVDQALELHDHLVQPGATALTVFTDFPAAASALARPHSHDPRLAQKWDLVIAGVEIATGYTEQHQAPAGTPSSDAADTELLSAEWAAVFADMPPSGGLCIGLDRLVMLLAGASSISDAVAFPLEPPA